MPKLKTNKSAKKRFKVTAKGRIKRSRAGKSHLMRSFTGKRVRALRRPAMMSGGDEKVAKRMLGVD
ncbi:MAG: 50S ribosomal protein L35 [Planctomycetes bacterium]|nr:50S ribosomal protein L35 [Planctomycetota bacterium]